MQLQIVAKSSVLCCHLANINEDSDSTFCQINLVFVQFFNMAQKIKIPSSLHTLMTSKYNDTMS